MPHSVQTLTVGDSEMSTYLSIPDGDGPFPESYSSRPG